MRCLVGAKVMCHLQTGKGRPIRHVHTSDDGHIIESNNPKDICNPICQYRGDPKIIGEMIRDSSQREFLKWSKVDAHFKMVNPHTPCYNCVGKVFGARNMIVDASYVVKILEDDEYYRVDGNARIGDIVIYRREGAIMHVGFVHKVSEEGGALVVQSKWGLAADYLHGPYSVWPFYGEPEVWRTDLPLSQRTRSVTAS